MGLPPAVRRILVKLVIFVLPFAIFPGLPIGIAAYSGEFAPLTTVAHRQMGPQPLLYGRAYRDNFFAFKLTAARLRRPEVVVLGSSRVMQFRAMFFNKRPRTFYNAGGAAQGLGEADAFFRELARVETPKIVIIGLDQVWFLSEPDSDPEARVRTQIDEEKLPTLKRALQVNRLIVLDIWQGKISLPHLLSGRERTYGVPALGINAIMNGKGFRNDGSYQYGDGVRRPPAVEERMAEGFERLRNNTVPMTRGDRIIRGNLATLEAILKFGKVQGTTIVGFSPPFAPMVYRAIRADGKHEYLAEMALQLKPLFEAYGFRYFDFSDPTPVGGVDGDMLDAFHPSEFLCLLMYIQMLRAEPLFGHYSDLEFLDRLAHQAPSNRFELLANRFD